MKKLIYVFIIALFSACINKGELKDVFPIHLLNANSAKVWVVASDSSTNQKTPLKAYHKGFIFYSNFYFREQQLIYLGSDVGLVGKYTIDNSNGKIILTLNYLQVQKKPKQFVIHSVASNKMVLKSTSAPGLFLHLKTLSPPDF